VHLSIPWLLISSVVFSFLCILGSIFVLCVTWTLNPNPCYHPPLFYFLRPCYPPVDYFFRERYFFYCHG
jgi:hypothetical protein